MLVRDHFPCNTYYILTCFLLSILDIIYLLCFEYETATNAFENLISVPAFCACLINRHMWFARLQTASRRSSISQE